jgi:tripartite-type tricarboxylate transporter receptor subunit TctC
LSYDVAKDFAPIALVGEEQLAFAVNPSVPATNLAELAALIKASPGKYTFASSGNGNITHLTGELFKQQAGGLDLVHAAYKGAGPAVNDVLAGHVQMTVAGLGSVYTQHQAGKLRVLAIASEKRVSYAPDIPTAIESGFPNLVATSTLALLAPASTPAAVIDTLSGAIAKSMSDEGYLREMRQASVEPVIGSTPAKTGRFLADEVSKWSSLVKSANLKVQ